MEYALGVSLVLVVTLAGVRLVQSNSKTKLQQRGVGIGTPVENSAVRGGTGTGGGSGGGGGGGTATANVTTGPSLTGAATPDNGNKWIATITVTVIDSSGNPVAGAQVVGDWNPDTNKQTTTCTTSLSGTCTVTISNLQTNQDPSATYTVTAVTGNASGTLVVNYSGPFPSQTVNKP